MPARMTSRNTTFLYMIFVTLMFSLLYSLTSSTLSQKSFACKSTPYPHLCRWLLSAFNNSSSSSPFNYSTFSVKQSLKQAKRLSKLLNRYLSSPPSHRHVSSPALFDCAQLFELNVDYLQAITTELANLTEASVGRVESLLSGVVTNQQTCYDGLTEDTAWGSEGLAPYLHAPVVNGSELYSVALGLVTHALGKVKLYRKKQRPDFSGRALGDLGGSWKPTNRLLEILRKNPTGFPGDASEVRRGLAEMASNGIVINNTVTVSRYGDANFSTISEAIAFAPNNLSIEDGHFVIYVKKGYYEEYVTISKHNKGIMLLGDGINRTVISGNRSVVDGWTTFNSATFAVSGERFVAVGITFMNNAGPWKHQAVAVRNNADLSTFYKCSFIGYQDTLYVHSLRQFYRECDIYGTVDIIFGNAASVFQNCNLYARKPLPNQKNAFTAQGRSDPNQSTGISIHNCTIQAAPDLSMDRGSTLSYLGRPWHNYSRTVYMQSYIDDVIDPVGWLAWNESTALDTIYYGEFENYGPGANTTLRVQWPGYKVMTKTEAMNFTVDNFTMGETWLHYADIPFNSGLL